MSQSSALNKVEEMPQGLFDGQAIEAGTPAWKQEVNQRLAAHRSRRGGGGPGASAAQTPRTATGRAAAAAARVAARYAQAPSYSELLAGEARAVVRAAGAAAAAARDAQAAAQAVLTGLEFGFETGFAVGPVVNPMAAASAAPSSPAHVAPARWQDEPPAVVADPARETSSSSAWAGAQPRWEQALPVTAPASVGRDVWAEMRVHPHPEESGLASFEEDEHRAELFPYDPVAGATVEPLQHLPANLIEFPRELVATRKARPRLAEGPLYDPSQESPQLNIFEVDPALLAPPMAMSAHDVAPPEWASIELEHRADRMDLAPAYEEYAYSAADELPMLAVEAEPAELAGNVAIVASDELDDLSWVRAGSGAGVSFDSAPASCFAAGVEPARVAERISGRAVEPTTPAELLVAPVSDRLLAGVVDAALVTLAFLAAAVVVIASTEHPPTGKIALIASGCGLLLFGLLYQFLFLSFAEEGTLGMRYARIALCTFEDDNPTVGQMRMRIPALVLSAIPAGLGLVWAVFDSENLGWHDRMTRTYQRKY